MVVAMGTFQYFPDLQYIMIGRFPMEPNHRSLTSPTFRLQPRSSNSHLLAGLHFFGLFDQATLSASA